MSSFFSAQPKSKNKSDRNSPIEPTATKYVTPVVKENGNYSPPFDVNKELSSDEHKKFQGLFLN